RDLVVGTLRAEDDRPGAPVAEAMDLLEMPADRTGPVVLVRHGLEGNRDLSAEVETFQIGGERPVAEDERRLDPFPGRQTGAQIADRSNRPRSRRQDLQP